MIRELRLDLLRGMKAVVLDLEGVLVENMPYEELLEEISRIVGASYADLIRRYRTQWKGLEEARNYHCSLALDEESRMRVTDGYERFQKAKLRPDIVSGAKAFLELLQLHGFRVVCWTMGEEEFQRAVLKNSNLEPYFEAVVVVREKNAAAIKTELLPVLRDEPFALIGDSLKLDILPVLGIAKKLFWVLDSKANRYLSRIEPQSPPPGVVPVRNVYDFMAKVDLT